MEVNNVNMSGVSGAAGMSGMAGCSGSQHGQSKEATASATEKGDLSKKTQQVGLDPNLGQKVDLGI